MQCHWNGEPFHCSQDDPRDKETVKTLECAPNPSSGCTWACWEKFYVSVSGNVVPPRLKLCSPLMLQSHTICPLSGGRQELGNFSTLCTLSRIKLFIVESLKEIVRTKVNTYGSRSSVDSSHTAFKSWARAGSLTIINNWLFAVQLNLSQRRCPYLFLLFWE